MASSTHPMRAETCHVCLQLWSFMHNYGLAHMHVASVPGLPRLYMTIARYWLCVGVCVEVFDAHNYAQSRPCDNRVQTGKAWNRGYVHVHVHDDQLLHTRVATSTVYEWPRPFLRPWYWPSYIHQQLSLPWQEHSQQPVNQPPNLGNNARLKYYVKSLWIHHDSVKLPTVIKHP